jgi:Uma2 family endonuclease
MAITLERRRFTVHEYHRMADAGILGEDDGDELINGEILEGEKITPRHASCVNTCGYLCFQALGESAIISIQNPVRLSLYDEPLPDIALLRPPMDAYWERHPTAGDILLLIEVADSSFQFDRTIKLPIYATTGVPEVWLIDLNRQRILRYSEPHEGSYKVVRQFRPGRQITSVVVPELSVDTGAIFGL